jgi:acetylornithine deacetylase
MSLAPSDPVDLLRHLVSFRTDVTGDERPLADRLAELLAPHRPDAVTVADVPRADGKPAAYVYARFGAPKLLVNAHLDTVPPNADWSHDPFTARIDGGRLYALGAADTKGAAAAILAALASTRPVDTGILFSGDEEFSSVAMRAFLASAHAAGLERAIVCEPTNLRPGVRHRGFSVFEVTVSGPGGHSSKADEMPSPIGRLAALAVRLDVWATKHKSLGPPGFQGMCLNLAKLDGGIAFNVIPAEARLLVSLRPPPGADPTALYAELDALVAETLPEATTAWKRRNAPFATGSLAAFEQLLGDAARSPLDLAFWTEAALLRERGIDAVVLGPGNIAQAHAPNEWVEVDELGRAAELFRRVFSRTSAA